MKIRMLIVITTLMILNSGCCSEMSVKRDLQKCPSYFEQNVGKVTVLPSYSLAIPLAGGPVGWLSMSKEKAVLTSLASKENVFHEMFHIFDYNCAKNRPREWKTFTKEFSGGKPSKPNLPLYLFCATMPLVQYIPVKGHVKLYSLCTGAEDAADTFAFYMCGKRTKDPELLRKIQVIKNYVEGKYSCLEDVDRSKTKIEWVKKVKTRDNN